MGDTILRRVSWLGRYWGGVVLVTILAMALWLRLFSLATIPPNVVCDEADSLQVVYHILEGTGPGPFGLDWHPLPAFSAYLMAGSMRLFGLSIVGMRMVSVVLSVLGLAVFYLLARCRLGIAASLAATFLMSTGLWYLHFSRNGWPNVHVCLYVGAAALTLTLALDRDQWRYYAASGFFTALGLYGHYSGRMIIAAILAYLPFALWLHRHRARRVALGYLLLLAVCAATFAPQAVTISARWDYFNQRVQTVSIFNIRGSYLGATGTGPIILQQVWRTMDAFILMDSSYSGFGLNSRYIALGKAFLDPATTGLFWLGMIVSIFRWRKAALWWCFFLVPVFGTQVFSIGSPDGSRAVIAVPFIYLFVGAAFDWLFGWRLRLSWVLRAVALVLLPAIACINIGGYFHWMNEPLAASARQPAVEIAEFGQWQQLQIEAARRGEWGFNVNQWHEMRRSLPTPSPEETD